MHKIPQVVLLLILLLTVGLTQQLTAAPIAQTGDSPLATPWRTLVVTYEPQLPTAQPTLAPTATAKSITFLQSPLPTPTPTTISDTDPPQTTLRLTGQQSDNDWYRSPVTLTFAITDNLGAGLTAYQLDGAPTWTTREYYYPPVVLNDEGVHVLAYRSLDRAHNQEATQSAQIHIDRTPPQTDEPIIDGNQLANGWYNTPVTVTLQGQDALAGMAGFEMAHATDDWTVGAATTVITNSTQQTLTWRAVDNAGNVSPAQMLTLLVDMKPPTTTHTIAPLPSGGWYSTPVTVSLTALDEGSGLFQTDYRLDNAATWQRYAAPFTISDDGLHTVDYQSSDRALNREAPNTFTVSLDRTPPVIAGTLPPTVTIESLILTERYTVTDDVSGVVTTTLWLNGVPYQPGQSLRFGENLVVIQAWNGAGLVANVEETIVVVNQPLYLPLIQR